MKYIWAVGEDVHGIVSYWDSKEKALEEAKKICEDMFFDEPFEITEEEEETIEMIGGVVYITRYKLNESWV